MTALTNIEMQRGISPCSGLARFEPRGHNGVKVRCSLPRPDSYTTTLQ